MHRNFTATCGVESNEKFGALRAENIKIPGR